jgi:F-type H+-transporting ATPase subunit gamma
MAKPRAILKRRHAVQGIAKITKTMQMIATAKYKRAFNRAVAARPYTDRLRSLIRRLTEAAGELKHPLLEVREPKRVAVLAIAGNRGLCGGYNSNVGRALAAFRARVAERGLPLEIHACGKKLGGMLKYQKVPVASFHKEFEDKPGYAEVDALASALLARYAAGEIDEVHIVYTKFESASRQHAVSEQVLPLRLKAEDPERVIERGPERGAGGDESKGAPSEARWESWDDDADAKKPTPDATDASDSSVIFEPDAATILADLLPRSVRIHVFQAFLDAAVSEQTARMVAMKSATDNARDMIKSLTMLYNRSRQTLITTELSEIMGGAAALE